MKNWREEIASITSSNKTISFSLWNDLLNFFNNHKEELDYDDIKRIVNKSEECRLYLNEHTSSFIKREEVVPNIYEYFETISSKNKSS